MVHRQGAHPLLFGLTAGMPTLQLLREWDTQRGRVVRQDEFIAVKLGKPLAQVGTLNTIQKSDFRGKLWKELSISWLVQMFRAASFYAGVLVYWVSWCVIIVPHFGFRITLFCGFTVCYYSKKLIKLCFPSQQKPIFQNYLNLRTFKR